MEKTLDVIAADRFTTFMYKYNHKVVTNVIKAFNTKRNVVGCVTYKQLNLLT